MKAREMSISSSIAVATLWIAPPLLARQSHQDLHAALESWRARHGATWEMVRDDETGFARLVYGGSAAPAFAPREDADFFALARLALDDSRTLHGIDSATLLEDDASFLPLGNAGSSDKESVQFRQAIDGVPVEHGFVNVLFDLHGTVLSIDTTALPELAGLSVVPEIEAREAASAAARFLLADEGLRPESVGTPELAIEQVVREGRRVGVLAWQVRVDWRGDGTNPLGFTYAVDARDASRVARRSEIHSDVSGHVDSMISPGALPDESSNPEAPTIAKRVHVTTTMGEANTDENGDFTIVGATAPIDATFTYDGAFCTAHNASGADYQTTTLLTADSGNAVTMNTATLEYDTAQANAYHWSNELRDWVRAVNPADSHADLHFVANCNQVDVCNAFYDGISTNFFLASACVNTAYSSVVLHESGHWLNDRYGSGNGSDGFGEGNADVYALYRLDDPYNGRDWSGPGTYVRTGNNTRQFCGDCCGGCYGEVHDDGEVLMGALWKVRVRLKNSLGTQAGGAAADALFNAWMNAYNDGQIKTIIRTHWLVLDDDDANLSNGTPHLADIDGGFHQQGFPSFVPPCPTPVVYCTAKTTSIGSTPSIGWNGTPTVAANNFALTLVNAIPDHPILMFYGSAANSAPFYGGTLCAQQPVHRSKLMTLNSFGGITVAVPVDPSMVGNRRFYQFWFRDGQHPDGTGVGLSDALDVRFCQN